jgi:hypothetical protein
MIELCIARNEYKGDEREEIEIVVVIVESMPGRKGQIETESLGER